MNILLNFPQDVQKSLKLPVHHIGIACKNIEKEFEFFRILGFRKHSSFIDEAQGIRGEFIVPSDEKQTMYCFELLQNIGEKGILDSYLKNNVKMYHIAFETCDIEVTLLKLQEMCAMANDSSLAGGGGLMFGKPRVITPLLTNEYFSRFCFVMLPNRLLIELVEIKK